MTSFLKIEGGLISALMYILEVTFYEFTKGKIENFQP